MKWTDTLDIAIELDENHPDIDPILWLYLMYQSIS